MQVVKVFPNAQYSALTMQVLCECLANGSLRKSMLEDSARELLAREGYDPNFGARPLKRAIQTLIQNPLAMKLLRGEVLPGQNIVVSARNGHMEFSTEPRAVAA